LQDSCSDLNPVLHRQCCDCTQCVFTEKVVGEKQAKVVGEKQADFTANFSPFSEFDKLTLWIICSA
jgi:hypothetical protein